MSRFRLSVRLPATAGLTLTLAGAAFAQDATPQAPYVFRGTTFVEAGVTFDEAAVRAALPDGLEPVEGFTGGLDVYTVEAGSGIGAYSAGYVWIDVAGHDGPDGAPGRYMVRGFYSGPFHAAEDLATTSIVLGSGTVSEEGDTYTGSAGPEGEGVVEIAVKIDSAACAPGVGGMSNYVLPSEEGDALNLLHVPLTFDWCDGEALTAEVHGSEGDGLAGLTPRSVIWAGVATNASFAFVKLEPIESP